MKQYRPWLVAENIRWWIRMGNDTLALAQYFEVPESLIWNRLAEGDRP